MLWLTWYQIALTSAANQWIKYPGNGKRYIFHSDCVDTQRFEKSDCYSLNGTGLAIPGTNTISISSPIHHHDQ